MHARTPSHNAFGTIDLEINHPVYGWIPFTASPADSEQIGQDLFARAVAGEFGPVAPYVAPAVVPPTPEQTEALRRAAYQAEADPLFFKSQRGEAQQSDWLAKVAEIKSRFPE
jgi:hypothetical protein